MSEPVDCGYISVGIENANLTFSDKQGPTIALEVGVEFVNCGENAKWKENDLPKSNSVSVSAVPNGPAPEKGATEFPYSCQFDNMQRSNYIDLNQASIDSLVNGSIQLRITAVTETTVAGPKGSSSVQKTEDVIVEITVPLASLFAGKGCCINSELNFDELIANPPVGVAVNVKNAKIIKSLSSCAWKVAADNDLAEYLLGCCLFRWEEASLSSIPAVSWAIQSPDVIDPKAKVPKTADDLRKLYLENVAKLSAAATQPDQIQFTVDVGGATESGDGASDLISPFTLKPGLLSFKSEEAAAAPVEEDIRKRTDLWSLNYNTASPWIFYQRANWLKLKNTIQRAVDEGTDGSKLAVCISKLPGNNTPDSGCSVSKVFCDLGGMLVPGVTGGSLNASLSVFTEGEEEVAIGSREEAAAAANAAAGAEHAAALEALEEGAEPPAAPVPTPVPPVFIPEFTLRYTCTRPFINSAPKMQTNVAPLDDKGRLMGMSTSASKMQNTNVNRDVKGELRAEIQSVVRQIALEYVALYPLADSTEGVNIADTAERKAEFMYYLSSSGVYHMLKEKLKPKIQRSVREMFGVRGRAINPNSQFLPPEGYENEADIPMSALLGELYVFLTKETNIVLNEMYESTVVKRDMVEIEQSNRLTSATGTSTGIDDEKETQTQAFERSLDMAWNAEADERFWVAEQYHLERIQAVKNCPLFKQLTDYRHSAYAQFGEFMQRRAAWTILLAKSATSEVPAPGIPRANGDMLFEDAQYFTSRARQALEAAIDIDPSQYKSVLLLVSILLDTQEYDRAYSLMADLMSRLLNIEGYPHNVGIFSYDQFEEYQDNQLVNGTPIDPLCYVVLAMIFTVKGNALGARKAILMANRCYASDLNNYPPVSAHGKPRRTAVLNLIRGSVYFYEYGLVTLGNAAYTLAVESDKAVTAKAMARAMFADTVSYVRHLLKKGECYYTLYNSGDVSKALEIANECVAVSVARVDNCAGWLLVAKVLSITQHDMISLMDAYASAVHAAATTHDLDTEIGSVETFTIPLRDILAYSKALITTGGNKYNDALRLLLGECTTRCTSASLFLYIGICCLRLELLADAEDALQEANLLENRNPDIWAYLCLYILATGSMHRIEEAERSMAQAIRLGLSNSPLLRELAISFMSIDKFVVAEDLVRRGLAIETGGGGGGLNNNSSSAGTLMTSQQQQPVSPISKGNAHTRKLMGDILAAQNQAVNAIVEYQGVISDMDVEGAIRIAAGEKCLGLLMRLGRDDEAKQLRFILNQLNSQQQQ